MNISTFDNISMNGRMAYGILCIETYLLAKFPVDDWTPLSKIMWEVTSSPWDEWADKFMEIIPEYLFEKTSFEESDFDYLSQESYSRFVSLLTDKPETVNALLMKLHEIEEVYCYSSIPQNGVEASQIVLDICGILESEKITLPDISLVSFSAFSEKHGWGNFFDGTKLSQIL